jgi:hypothetical protein
MSNPLKVYVVGIAGTPADGEAVADLVRQNAPADCLVIPAPFGEVALGWESEVMVADRALEFAEAVRGSVDNLIFVSTGLSHIRRIRLMLQALPQAFLRNPMQNDECDSILLVPSTSSVNHDLLRERSPSGVGTVNLDMEDPGAVRSFMKSFVPDLRNA